MRVIYCVTLFFILISHASWPILASPLPPHNADMLSWNPLGSLMRAGSYQVEVPDDKACLDNPNNDGPDVQSSPRVDELTTVTSKEYTTSTKTSKTTNRRSRTSKSHSSTSTTMVEPSPGSLFFTTFHPLESSSSINQRLSPLKPLSDIGETRVEMATPPPQSTALPWVLGFLIPTLIFGFIWLAIQYDRRRKQLASTSAIINPSDSYTSDANATTEKNDLNIRSEGPYNTSALLALPPLSIQSLNMNLEPSISADRRAQGLRDRFELKAARFPTHNELSSYVFPSTVAGVEREVRATKVLDAEASTHNTALIIPSTRPLIIPRQRIVPRQFVSRVQATQRKRLSPMGDVLYSTGGGTLETVHEETMMIAEEELQTPKAAYKGGKGEFFSGPRDEQALASGNSYVSSSPVGLRARRRSSPIIPEITFNEPSPSLGDPPQGFVAPLQINKTRSSTHRRSATKSEVFGSIGLAERALGNPAFSSADEEERKFAEFIKELVKSQEAHARRRQHHRQATISLAIVEGGSHSPVSAAFQSAPAFRLDAVNQEKTSILLPPPSIGATLSDFAVSSSTLASDVASSSSRFSIGIAL